MIPLAVGSNVITVEVTAEDGNTAKTYTVTVTRAEPASGPAATIELSPSGPVEEGTEVTVTMSFGGLERDSDPNDVGLHLPGRRGIPPRREQCGCL